MLGQRDLTTSDYISIARRRWHLIAFLAIVGSGIGYGVTHFLPKRFTSQTLVLVVQPTVPGDYVKPVVTDDTNQRLAAMQQQILSRTHLETVIQQLGLYPSEVGRVPMDQLVQRLQLAIVVTPVEPMAETRSSNLPGFTVAVTMPDARVAQQICSTVTSMFMQENTDLRQQQSEKTTQFLSQQLDDAKAKLDEQNSKLADFKRRYLGSLPDEEQTNLNLLTGFNSQLEAATQALSRAQQDKTYAESVLTQQLNALQATTPEGQNPDTLQQQLATLEAQLASLKARYTDDYPDVIKAKSDIEALKKQVAEAQSQPKPSGTDKPARTTEPLQIQSLRAQIHQYDQVIQERTAQQEQIQQQIKLYQSRVQSTPAVEQEYKEITQDYQSTLDFYNNLLKERNQASMATNLERDQQGEQFQVVDPASLPMSPSFPKKPLFLLGGFGGGFALGLGISLLLELQDTSLRNERDVEALLDWPVLAMVPALKPMIKNVDGAAPKILAKV